MYIIALEILCVNTLLGGIAVDAQCRASSNKVGGGGIRYTVQIHGQEKYLFCEGNKWFVEARA